MNIELVQPVQLKRTDLIFKH